MRIIIRIGYFVREEGIGLVEIAGFLQSLEFLVTFFQEKSDRRPARREKQRSIQAN
jgi:hypothetical protein